MKRGYREGIIIILLISMLGLIGCGMEKPEKVYSSVIEAMSEDEAYAYVERPEGGLPVLLIAEGTYSYDEDTEAAITCRVYYAWDGEVKEIGTVESLGTAYPVRYDENWIYAAGGHFAAQYAVDDSQKQLVAVQYVNENFDTDGNASYTYFDSENGEQETQDPSYFENMFEIYEKAKIVNFKR